MTSGLTIREASPADAAAIARLSGVLGYPAEEDVVRARLERLLARPEDVVFAADLPGVGLIGWLHAAAQETLESGRSCELVGLVVDAGHRRLGAGRLLVQAAERWARAHGLERVSVRSNVVRVESHPFYEGLGYTRAKTQHAYRKRLVPGDAP